MADPTSPDQAIATLTQYWSDSMANIGDVSGWITGQITAGDIQNSDTLYQATQLQSELNDQAVPAMTSLVSWANGNDTTRQLFATSNVFDNALTLEKVGVTDLLIQKNNADNSESLFGALTPSVLGLGEPIKPPRLIMLEGIYKGGTLGFIKPQDPTGIASWIHSDVFSTSTIISVLASETDGRVIAQLLQILNTFALPISWVQALSRGNEANQHNDVLSALQARAGTTQWSQDATSQLNIQQAISNLSDNVRSRMSQLYAANRSSTLTLKTVALADGTTIQVTPPGDLPWYRNDTLLFVGSAVAGLLAGGYWFKRKK